MRLFVAIELPTVYKAKLKQLQNKLRTVVDPSFFSFSDSFHLTLAFLGEQPAEKVEQIKEALGQFLFSSFDVTLTDVGFFPSEEFVKVIWIGVKPKEPLGVLEEQIRTALEPLEYKSDKEFHPHITLARVKSKLDKSAVKIIQELEMPKCSFEVTNFYLFGSELTPNGAIHKKLASFP